MDKDASTKEAGMGATEFNLTWHNAWLEELGMLPVRREAVLVEILEEGESNGD